MFRHSMADDEVREGYHIERPNRTKASSKLMKLVVAVLLLGSAALLLIVTVGGWDKLSGIKGIQVAYIAIYVVMAFLVMGWNRGVLPMAAALAIILAIFAAIAGGAWATRGAPGYADTTLNAEALSLVVFLIVPVQILLIVFAMRAFSQGWNVEVEVPDGETYSPRKHGDLETA